MAVVGLISMSFVLETIWSPAGQRLRLLLTCPRCSSVLALEAEPLQVSHQAAAKLARYPFSQRHQARLLPVSLQLLGRHLAPVQAAPLAASRAQQPFTLPSVLI